jgi:hypothetical protein
MTGLRSHKCSFTDGKDRYEAKGFLIVKSADGEPRDAGWKEDLVRKVTGGWWVGERTGTVATKVRIPVRSERGLS